MKNPPDPHEFRGELPAGALAEPRAGVSPRERLRRLALDCSGLLGDGASQIVPGEGNTAAALMLVGEAPGEEEDRQGRPFVGRSGKLLEQVLAAAGFDRRDLWITNTVKHRPVTWEDGKAKNRPPSAAEITAWRPCLETEIELVRPRLIVGLGAVAGRALVDPTFKITRQRGGWFDDTVTGGPVLVTWHPAYILRQTGDDYRARLGEAIADFQQAFRRLDAPQGRR
ncbi:MAG: uracil-DNA glycosylase [Candidatus Sericytochromatia bacterium]